MAPEWPLWWSSWLPGSLYDQYRIQNVLHDSKMTSVVPGWPQGPKKGDSCQRRQTTVLGRNSSNGQTKLHAFCFLWICTSIISQTWIKNNERQHDHNLRNDNDYMLPNPRLEQFKRFPIYSLPFKWNQAGVVTLYENKTTFRIALKGLLFEEVLEGQ